MFCSNCREELPEGANFCLKCGARQSADQPEAENTGSERDTVAVTSDGPAAEPAQSAAPWIMGSIAAIFLLFVVVALVSSPASKSDQVMTETVAQEAANMMAPPEQVSQDASATVPATSTMEASEPAEDDALSGLTAAELNARRSAISYLEMTGFSREGLIQQLSSEYGSGYSREDAEAAVDSLDVDWRQNALRSAKQYLDMTGFSCSRLIEQLSSEHGSKYTLEEAEYGASAAGAC